jgi:hypothetical protein
MHPRRHLFDGDAPDGTVIFPTAAEVSEKLTLFALPCLALPCLALPCLALPCLAIITHCKQKILSK